MEMMEQRQSLLFLVVTLIMMLSVSRRLVSKNRILEMVGLMVVRLQNSLSPLDFSTIFQSAFFDFIKTLTVTWTKF